MPNHERRNILWAAAAMLVLPLLLGPGALDRIWGAAGRRRREEHPESTDPGPRICLPAGSVRRHG